MLAAQLPDAPGGSGQHEPTPQQCGWYNLHAVNALFSPNMPALVQKLHRYTENLNSETPDAPGA